MIKKIIQNRDGCIGCGTCVALCPKFWEIDDVEVKANLKDAKKNEETGEYELEIEEAEIGCNKDAVESCPVQVIRIV